MRTRALGCTLAITAICVAIAATPAHAGEPRPPSHDEALFALYCSSCHGRDARGRTARDEGASGPDLTHLAEHSGRPEQQLALTPLVEFVTSPRRPGAQRICGDRVFARLPEIRFRERTERWIVRSALQHVATRQGAQAPSSLAPSGPEPR
jgi:hypothetical protein